MATSITHRVLKNEQGRVFRELPADGTVEIRNRDRVDGVLVSPERFADLQRRADEAQRLRAALPLLLAAARTGVAVPSETFERLGIPGRDDWRALNALLAAIPVEVTLGEDGEPLPDASAIELVHTPVEESEEELRLR